MLDLGKCSVPLNSQAYGVGISAVPKILISRQDRISVQEAGIVWVESFRISSELETHQGAEPLTSKFEPPSYIWSFKESSLFHHSVRLLAI